MRPIKPNEEITIDYAITEGQPDWKMTCFCGAKNCRKLIKSITSLPLPLFKKYQPYIPKFLENIYFN